MHMGNITIPAYRESPRRRKKSEQDDVLPHSPFTQIHSSYIPLPVLGKHAALLLRADGRLNIVVKANVDMLMLEPPVGLQHPDCVLTAVEIRDASDFDTRPSSR